MNKKRKKYLAIILSIALAVAVFPGLVFANDEEEQVDIIGVISEETITEEDGAVEVVDETEKVDGEETEATEEAAAEDGEEEEETEATVEGETEGTVDETTATSETKAEEKAAVTALAGAVEEEEEDEDTDIIDDSLFKVTVEGLPFLDWVQMKGFAPETIQEIKDGTKFTAFFSDNDGNIISAEGFAGQWTDEGGVTLGTIPGNSLYLVVGEYSETAQMFFGGETIVNYYFVNEDGTCGDATFDNWDLSN